MDPATQERISQVSAWCTRQLDEFEAIYNRIRAEVWEDGRFKDGLEDQCAFLKWADAFKKTVPPTVKIGFVAEGAMRDARLLSEMRDVGGFLELRLYFGWPCSDDGVWSEGEYVRIHIETRRIDLGVDAQASTWRHGIPDPAMCDVDCSRRRYVPDTGPLREAEVVSMVAGVLGVGWAPLAENALKTATELGPPRVV